MGCEQVRTILLMTTRYATSGPMPPLPLNRIAALQKALESRLASVRVLTHLYRCPTQGFVFTVKALTQKEQTRLQVLNILLAGQMTKEQAATLIWE